MMKNPFTMTQAALFCVGLLAATMTAAQAQDAKAGDAKAGEKKAAMCIGCHGIPGYQSSFPEVYKVPMISGQNAAYIVAALNEYAKGGRKFPTMHGVAATLTDQDKADLAAFYSTSGGKAEVPEQISPSGTAAELLKKGNCQSCHGANLSKPIDPSYPKLAGQHADYLYYALKAYQTKNNPQVGRSNPVMGGMAAPFTHVELKTLAEYIGSLPSELKTVEQPKFR
ncbi:MAG: c-type cytochrome [Betaproteobacteria bacterium]